MSKYSIITIGSSGIDMRVNPLFLGAGKAAFAKNLAFEEGTIKTRPSIVHTKLGVKGVFQGGCYHTPSMGLSAQSYTNAPTGLAYAVNGKLWITALTDDPINEAFNVGSVAKNISVNLHSSENYLILISEGGFTCWWNGGELEASQGISDDCTEDDTHDELESSKNIHWLPNGATIGHYIHGRNHISSDYGIENGCEKLNSEVWVSDLVTKRDPCGSDDILKMEEAMLDSVRGSLTVPSRLGKTVCFETLTTNDSNGDGLLIDFRECGIATHNTAITPRESTVNKKGGFIQKGWDQQAITTVKSQTISCVGRYAKYRLPNDILFRSEFGFHFLKKSLGEGTIKDPSMSHESHDIQPLIDVDEGNDNRGCAVGHWIKGSRFMGTVGFKRNDKISTTAYGTGIAVLNQSTGFSEDDTPNMQWEGLWTLDKSIEAIHMFTNLGKRPKDKQFGFLASGVDSSLYASEITTQKSGVDIIDGKKVAIPFRIDTSAFLFHGTGVVDGVRNGMIEFIGDETTKNVKVLIRTDESGCWTKWEDIQTNFKERSLKSKSFGEPPKNSRHATWFQFRIEGEGYIEIPTFDVEAVTISKKDDGRNHCVPVCSGEQNYFD